MSIWRFICSVVNNICVWDLQIIAFRFYSHFTRHRVIFVVCFDLNCWILFHYIGIWISKPPEPWKIFSLQVCASLHHQNIRHEWKVSFNYLTLKAGHNITSQIFYCNRVVFGSCNCLQLLTGLIWHNIQKTFNLWIMSLDKNHSEIMNNTQQRRQKINKLRALTLASVCMQ